MYTPKRPVPSKTALRVLRQLAYISSGVVCGATAVVIEEQRRRTCLAKKIIDNARRLKQHPRHVQTAVAYQDPEPNHALFYNDEHATAFASDYGHHGRQTAAGRGHRRIQHDRRVAALKDPEVLRSDVLPSEVDKGYERWAVRHQGEQRKERHSRAVDSNVPLSFRSIRRGPTATGTSELQVETPERTLPYRPDTGTTSERIQPEPQDQEETLKRDYIAALRTGRDDIAVKKLWLLWNHSKARPIHEVSEEHRKIDQTNLEDLRRAPSPSENVTSSSLYLATEEQVLGVVTAFTGMLPTLAATIADEQSHRKLLHSLLRGLISFRLLPQIISLQQLCAEHGLLRWSHLTQIITFIEDSIADCELNQMVDALLALHPQILSLGTSERSITRVSAQIIHRVLSRSAGSTESDDLNRLCKAFAGRRGDEEPCATLRRLVVRLMHIGEHETSTRLFFSCMHDATPPQSSASLANDLIEHTTAAGKTKLTTDLLDWLNDSGFQVPAQSSLPTSTNATDPVVEYWTQSMLAGARSDAVPGEARLLVYQSLARLRAYKEAAILLHHSLSVDSDSKLLQDHQELWPSLLIQLWRDKKDFAVVEDVFSRMTSIDCSPEVFLSVHNAMINLCIKSNQLDLIGTYMQGMVSRSVEPDARTLGHLALAAAKKRDWTLVSRILLDHNSSDRFGQISEADRIGIFNPVLHEYAAEHSPEGLRRFAMVMTKRLDIVPSEATFRIVLDALVEGRKIQLLQPWITFVRHRGLTVKLNTDYMVAAIRKFYHAFKPSVVVLIKMLDRLGPLQKQLDSTELKILLNHAAAQVIESRSGLPTAARAREKVLSQMKEAHSLIDDEKDAHGTPIAADDACVEGSDIASNESSAIDVSKASVDRSESMDVQESRGSYSLILKARVNAEEERSKLDERKLQSSMMLAIAIKEPREALTEYRAAYAAPGPPRSTTTLTIAMQAALAIEGAETDEALVLINEAEAAGMDITAALLPVLVERIKQHRPSDEDMVSPVIDLVKNYYDELAKRGLPVRHHLAVTAATLLVPCHPAKAIEMLRIVYDGVPRISPNNKNSHAANRANGVEDVPASTNDRMTEKQSQTSSSPSDRDKAGIVPMTLFLRAFAKLDHWQGMIWVVDNVLSRDILLDARFREEFERLRKPLDRRIAELEYMSLKNRYPSMDPADAIKARGLAEISDARSRLRQASEKAAMRRYDEDDTRGEDDLRYLSSSSRVSVEQQIRLLQRRRQLLISLRTKCRRREMQQIRETKEAGMLLVDAFRELSGEAVGA